MAAYCNQNHDHLTETGRDGEPLATAAPMTCGHCSRSAHYDDAIDQYEHDDDSTCFLMGPTSHPC